MTNLTFDDGEPIDIAKLQNLYQLILDVKGQVDLTSIQNQNVKMTPIIYAGKASYITVTKDVTPVATLDYSAAKFDVSATPFVTVTPSASETNKDTTDIEYYLTNITSSSAKLMAKYTGTAAKTTASFHFIAVVMKITNQ